MGNSYERGKTEFSNTLEDLEPRSVFEVALRYAPKSPLHPPFLATSEFHLNLCNGDTAPSRLVSPGNYKESDFPVRCPRKQRGMGGALGFPKYGGHDAMC